MISTHPLTRAAAALALTTTLSLSGCVDADAGDRPTALRFSVLPDWNKGTLQRDSEKLAKLLGDKLGVEVRYEPSNDYTAAVNALIANKIDFVWLGGKTTCDAIDLGEDHVHVLGTRDIDLAFKTYFIANQDAIAAGKVSAVEDLAEWRGKTSELTFTFGSEGSTSGHLMPRFFLSEAGIDPDTAFRTRGYQKAGHGATLQAVASGAADLGALNYAYYDKASDADKAKAPIVHTTPQYVDYAWVVHDRIGADMVAKLKQALLGLDPEAPAEKEILDAWSAGSFQPASDEQWDSIRKVRDSLEKGSPK